MQYYGVCMCVCLYVWADGWTVCMRVHVCLNICLCVHITFTAVSTIDKNIYKDMFVVVDLIICR